MKLSLSPDLAELAPGEDAEFVVTIGNDGDQPLAPTLTINGSDPQQITLPDELVVLEPGGVADAVVHIRVPEQATPGEQRIGFSVTDPDGLHRHLAASATIRIGARPDVAVEVLPASSHGRRSARIQTVLHNRSARRVPIDLDGVAEGVAVTFYVDEVTLEPGEELSIPTRIERTRRSWFREIRHGAIIEARDGGPPVTAPATFVQRPALPPLLVKIIAAVLVLALWATAVVAINDSLVTDDLDLAKILVAPSFDTASGHPGDVFGAGAAGSGIPGSVQGAVTGPADPAGTDVVIERVAFGDEGTTSGGATTRLAAMSPVSTPLGRVIDRIETTTDDRGGFRFSSGLAVPAFYRVTATRPGFEVASQIVTTSEAEPDVEVEMELLPASGGMSGRVTDTDGNPIGGADISITDGSLDYSAISATEDGVGTWSVSGIATPQTYEVTVQRRGYATATLSVVLEGGEQLTGVDAQLAGGLGTVRGRVSNRGDGVGGVRISLEGEEAARETTTLTEGDLTGHFDFPALPYGTYQLTYSAEGWLTQTSEVVVDRGDVQIEVTDLRRSTAVVQGVVTQEVAPGGECRYPDPDVPDERRNAVLAPCGGIGVTLIGADATLRTTSATGDGSFQLSGIPGGEYLVRFDRHGYVSQFYEVDVAAGDILTLPADASAGPLDRSAVSTAAFASLAAEGSIQMRLTPEVAENTGEIQGVVRESSDPSEIFEPPAGTRITIDDQPDATTEQLADGAFRITGLLPGAHTIRIEAPGYDVRTRVVQVSLAGVSDVGAVDITALGGLALRMTGGQASVVGDAEVFVVPDPAVYGDGLREPPVMEDLDDAVDECRREFEIDGDTWDLDGLCATTDAVGDVEFTRSFSTGNYVMVTPTNQQDAADDPATRATTVPLDHERLVRRVDIESGAVTRLDPSLRRYPILQGAIRAPSSVDDGLQAIDVERDDIEFVRIDPDTGAALPLPDGAPEPRISASGDPDSSLDPGRYRIDRIPSDDADDQNLWQLVIRTDVGVFIRGPGQPPGEGPIDGLTFNESRTISALLLPDRRELIFDFVWEDANGNTEVGVPDPRVQVRGTSRFIELDQPPYFRAESTTCPGPGCSVIAPGDSDLYQPFSYEYRPGFPQRVFPQDGLFETCGVDDCWLGTGSGDPVGQVVIPPFFRPDLIFADITADGFASILTDPNDPQPLFNLPAPDADEELDEPYVHEVVMVPDDRDVTGVVQLSPGAATYHPFLADADLGGLTGDADILDELDVEIRLVEDEVTDPPLDTVSLAGAVETGRFTFDDLQPGTYSIRILDPRTGGPPVIEESSAVIDVTPGSDPYIVGSADPDDVTVQRRGIIRVDVEGQLLNAAEDGLEPGPLEGVDVELVRSDGETESLVTCDDTLTGGGPACEEGVVTFTDLDIFGPDGNAWDYVVQVSATGGYVRQDQVIQLGSQPYQLVDLALLRFGEVRGSVEGLIGDPPAEPLDDRVDVTLVDFATKTPVHGVQVSTDADGDFTIGPDQRIPPRTVVGGARYDLRFERSGYQDRYLGTPLDFAYDHFESLAPVVMDALPVNLLGVVSGPNGEIMTDELAGGFGISVSLTDDNGDAVELGMVSGASYYSVTTRAAASFQDPEDGTVYDLGPGGYVVDGIDAGTYTAVFTPITGSPDDTRFLTYEEEVTLAPGETVVLDVIQPYQAAPLEGTVTLEAFDGATLLCTESADPDCDASGVMVTATSTDGDVFTTETDVDGGYAFPTLPADDYDLTFDLDGYGQQTAVAQVLAPPVPEPPGPTATVDQTLTATAVAVEVDLDSAASTIGDLDGVEVVATYLGADAGDLGDAVIEQDTDGDGIAAFVIPPGDWRFAVVGSEARTIADRPHQPGQIEREVPLAQQGVTIPVAYDLDLDPYVQVSGSVTLADGEDPDGVTVAVVDGSGDVVGEPQALNDIPTTAANGDWRIWLDSIPADADDLFVRFSLVGYDTVSRPLDDDLTFVDDLDADLDVELDVNARDVEIRVQTEVDGADLDDLEVVAELDGQTVTGDVDGFGQSVEVTFADLAADETWSISTSNASDAADIGFPHMEVTDLDLAVTPGSGTLEIDGLFIDWEGELEGNVQGRDYADAPTGDRVDLAGVTVDVAQDGGGGSVSTTTDADGDWVVGVLDQVAGDITFSDADGYEGRTIRYAADGGNEWTQDDHQVDVVLTAATRDLVVTLTTPAGDDGDELGGMQLVATPDDDTNLAGVSATVVAGDGGGTATATFADLAPHAWTVTVSDGIPDVPHNLDVEVAIDVGDGDVTDEFVFALLTGTVERRDYDGAALEAFGAVEVRATQRGETAAVDTDANGDWSLGVMDVVEVELSWEAQSGYETPDDVTIPADDVTGTVPNWDVVYTASPVQVAVEVGDSGSDDLLDDIDVRAEWDPPADEPEPPIGSQYVTTGVTGAGSFDDGEVLLDLAPGQWLIIADDPDSDSTGYDQEQITFGPGDPVPTVALEIAANSVLHGSVVEVRGGDKVALEGVRITADRDGESFATRSTAPDGNGDNYHLRARAGTWEIAAERDGDRILVEEAFEIRKDGSGTERNWLEIVLPTTVVDMGGRVVGEGGGGVEGAIVTAHSSVGTVATTTDEEGNYTLKELDNRVTWAVTFAPPDGYEAQPVTRYLALSGDTNVELSLDQTLPTALGTIALAITGGQPSQNVETVLTESTPFPTLNEDGRVVRQVQLDADGAAALDFEDLVPGDGNSVPQNRFTLEVTAEGHDPLTRSGLDVTPGGRTVVDVDLGGAGPTPVDVELTLLSNEEPVVDADVRLEQGTVVLGPPVSPADSNVYAFSNVEPGEWSIVAEGFEKTRITVEPVEDEPFEATVELTALPEAGDSDGEDPDTAEGADDDDRDRSGTGDGGSGDGSDDTGDGGSGDGSSSDGSDEPSDSDGSDEPSDSDGSDEPLDDEPSDAETSDEPADIRDVDPAGEVMSGEGDPESSGSVDTES